MGVDSRCMIFLRLKCQNVFDGLLTAYVACGRTLISCWKFAIVGLQKHVSHIYVGICVVYYFVLRKQKCIWPQLTRVTAGGLPGGSLRHF